MKFKIGSEITITNYGKTYSDNDNMAIHFLDVRLNYPPWLTNRLMKGEGSWDLNRDEKWVIVDISYDEYYAHIKSKKGYSLDAEIENNFIPYKQKTIKLHKYLTE